MSNIDVHGYNHNIVATDVSPIEVEVRALIRNNSIKTVYSANIYKS